MSVTENWKATLEKINSAYNQAPPATRAKDVPKLVAISKLKPKEDIIECYRAGQRIFGENYVQELYTKSNDADILAGCPDIRWHFVGNCQIKNVSKLMRCPNLTMVETVASKKLADKLQNCCVSKSAKLDVMVQVNSSEEEQKGGVPVSEVSSLVKYVLEDCPNLNFVGLMTIGSLNQSLNEEANRDFVTMVECRKRIAEEIGRAESDIKLSMGMSNDMEIAVAMGSNSVRVGSNIFGARITKRPED